MNQPRREISQSHKNAKLIEHIFPFTAIWINAKFA